MADWLVLLFLFLLIWQILSKLTRLLRSSRNVDHRTPHFGVFRGKIERSKDRDK